MTVITQRQQPQPQPQVVTTPRRRKVQKRKSQKSTSSGSLVVSSLKASLIGGISMLLLMSISLIPLPILAFLVVPGFLVVSGGMPVGRVIAAAHLPAYQAHAQINPHAVHFQALLAAVG